MKKIYTMLMAAALVTAVWGESADAGTSASCGSCVKSVPCSPKSRPAPRGPYKRDVLGDKIPVRTDNTGTAMNDVAAGYHHGYIITGGEKDNM